MLAERACCEGAKRRCLALEPYLNESLCRNALRETGDAVRLLEAEGLAPVAVMEGLSEAVRQAELEELLTPAQLSSIAMFSSTCRRMASYLRKGESLRIELSLNGRAFLPLEDVELEIDDAIRGDTVADSASNALRDIRRKIDVAGDQMRLKLSNMLRAHPDWYADAFVAVRQGRQTLPVKIGHRLDVKGSVIDRSQTGGTLFIEPAAVREAQDALDLLRLEEENEVRRVLYALSALASDAAPAIRANMRLMETLDFAFAKGKLSIDMRACEPMLTLDRAVVIRDGVHPLLDAQKAVPLNFRLGAGEGAASSARGLIVTGPNTGGKTVSLKTVGLFCLMAQSGLHVPAGEGTTLPMCNLVLCDIGDGQSISENLSTFSAHMTRVLRVLKSATRESLVLLDELGSGTDPAEGMGLAVAILDELVARECLFAVTTHYPEIKEYARRVPGVVNARMAFDPATLSPLYRLEIGEAGESCALYIAKRLGFPDELIERARKAAYGAKKQNVPGEMFEGRSVPAPAIGPQGGAPRVTDFEKPKQAPERARKFGRGDSVRVYPENVAGIVAEETDDRGEILVQLRGKKKRVSHKRLKLIAKAEQMYPPEYDFSIVFDTVANRKAIHDMGRKHDPNAVAVYAPEE